MTNLNGETAAPAADSSLDDIAGILLDTMPEVSEHAIAEHDAAQGRNFDASSAAPVAPQTASNPQGLPVDKNGKPYDPSTHEISPKTGKAIKKRSGVKSSVVNPAQNTAAANSAISQKVDELQKAHMNGRFAAGATFAALQGIFGEEFAPRKDAALGDEFEYLTGAYGDYFAASGMTDIPPGWALVIAIGSIAAPRFAMPKTKSRLTRLKDWAISKVFAWKARRVVKTATDNQNEAE